MDNALQQSTYFTAIMRSLGVTAGETTVEGRTAQYIDRGPVRYFARPDPEIDPRALRERPVTLVNSQCHGQLRHAGFMRLMTGASIAVLDTRVAMCPLPKWRGAVAHARALHVYTTHRPLCQSDSWIFDKDIAQQSEKKFRALPHAISHGWPARRTVLSTAWNGKTPIAAMLTLLHDRAATYQIGWSGPEGRAKCAHHLLLTQLAEKLQAIGVSTLELGVIDTVNTPGLARFKIGTGAKIHQLGGTWIAFGRGRG